MCLHPLAQVYHTVIASHEQENALPQAPDSVSQQHNGLQYAHDSGVGSLYLQSGHEFGVEGCVGHVIACHTWACEQAAANARGSADVNPAARQGYPSPPQTQFNGIGSHGDSAVRVVTTQPGPITPRIETGSVWRASEKMAPKESSDHHMLASGPHLLLRPSVCVVPCCLWLPSYPGICVSRDGIMQSYPY